MKSDLDNKLVAVIRIRGTIGVRRTIKETLIRMNLNRVNSLALLYGNPSNLGMIKKCNDFVTYGEINADTLGKVLTKKGVKSSKEDVEKLLSGEKKAKEVLQLPIRLKPPRRGYEDTKTGFSRGGATGFRGEAINEILKRLV